MTLLDEFTKSLFPEMFKIIQNEESENEYTFRLLSKSESACCLKCCVKSRRAHSYQEKRARDLPIFGKRVTLEIIQKKYFCDNRNCEVDIFTESNSLANLLFTVYDKMP